MENQQRIRATSPVKWLVCLALILFLMLANYLKLITRNTESLVATVVCAVVVIPGAIWNLIHVKYLTSEGVEVIRFGRRVHFISWKHTAQICIARETKNSSLTFLLVTPVNCEMYNAKKWSGRSYAFRYRKQVITIDNTEKNRQVVSEYCGEITDMRNS